MLPGDAYTKGFMRTYAEFLGLDGQLYVDEYNARIAAHHEEPLVPETLDKTRNRATSMLVRSSAAVLLVGALVGGLVAWRHAGGPARPHLQAAAAAPRPTAHLPPTITAKAAPAPVRAAPKPTFARIRAVTDRSWLSVRLGGPNGREIYRGTLEPGRQLEYALGRSIWVRMGRPLALDIRIGTAHVQNLPAAASNVLLTRSGARRSSGR